MVERRAMKQKDITWATVGILIVCLIMALTSGCKDKEAEAGGIEIDFPIVIGGDESTPCDPDDFCRIEYDENGDFTVITCKVHEPEPLVFDEGDVVWDVIEFDTDAPAVLFTADTIGADPNGLIIIDDWMDEAMDITFCMGNTEVVFTWTDEKFDVIYDANDLAGAAKTFFDSMRPYLNAHIKDAAERLNERASQ
jgi:hypothetical protein